MKIIGLQAENVKRLHAVRLEIDPATNMLVIGGPNGAGKTSLLDSVAMALGGKDEIPNQPIRQGASRAEIILTTDDIVVKRTFSASGTMLTITGKDGLKIASPQALLDRLTNTQCLDPLAFTRMDSRRQAETLRRLVGIDFAELDRERAAKYEERTGINREAKAQETRVDRLERHPNAPKEIQTVDAIGERLNKANEENRANEKMREALVGSIDMLDLRKELVKKYQTELEEAKAKLAKAETELAQAVVARDELHAKVQGLADVDTAPILAEVDEIQSANEKVRANERWNTENQRLFKLTNAAKALTDRIEAIDAEKERALAAAAFPVEGLSFTSDGVTFRGVPFAQASSAEQLRVSVAMGFAMQPQLKLALIRDGSLLDDSSLAMVAAMAAEQGATVLVERVGDGKECSVVMQDGEVAEVRPAKKGSKA